MDDFFSIGIGGVGISLQTEEPHVAHCLRKGYEAFQFSEPPEVSLMVSIDPTLKAGPPGSLEASECGPTLRVWSPVFEGTLDLTAMRGSLILGRQGTENSLANFLRNCFQWLLLARGGFLLHSAGLMNGSAAFLFFGPSGSGKTTLARQALGGRVLSDEYVAITLAPDKVMAWGTPFWGDMEEGVNTSSGGRLKALLRLRHGDDCRLEGLPASRGLAELLHCIPVVTGSKREAGQILDLASRVLDSVPCSTMHFKPGTLDWREIHGSFDHLSHKERPHCLADHRRGSGHCDAGREPGEGAQRHGFENLGVV